MLPRLASTTTGVDKSSGRDCKYLPALATQLIFIGASGWKMGNWRKSRGTNGPQKNWLCLHSIVIYCDVLWIIHFWGSIKLLIIFSRSQRTEPFTQSTSFYWDVECSSKTQIHVWFSDITKRRAFLCFPARRPLYHPVSMFQEEKGLDRVSIALIDVSSHGDWWSRDWTIINNETSNQFSIPNICCSIPICVYLCGRISICVASTIICCFYPHVSWPTQLFRVLQVPPRFKWSPG